MNIWLYLMIVKVFDGMNPVYTYIGPMTCFFSGQPVNEKEKKWDVHRTVGL